MRIFTLVLFGLFSFQTFAQLPDYYFKDRSNEGNVLLINLTYGGYISAGDLGDRFGRHYGAGGGFEFLSSKDYLVGVKSHFNFGDNVEEDVIAPLYNDDGFLFGENGSVAELQLRQRGIFIGGHVGKLFRLFETQRSGIRATIGAGFFQHKIRIQDDPLVFVPFLDSEYKKGYDRLTNGLGLVQFLGYQHLGRKRRVNFIVGFEVIEAFTKNRRSFNYDTRESDTESRLDISLGFKIGWSLPLYVGENADAIEY